MPFWILGDTNGSSMHQRSTMHSVTYGLFFALFIRYLFIILSSWLCFLDEILTWQCTSWPTDLDHDPLLGLGTAITSIIGYRTELSTGAVFFWPSAQSRGEVALSNNHLLILQRFDVDLLLVVLEVATNLDPQSMQQPDSTLENFSQGFKSVASSAGPLIGSLDSQ